MVNISKSLLIQVTNIGSQTENVSFLHNLYQILAYQITWTNWMMLLFGAKTTKLISSIKTCIGDTMKQQKLWTQVTLKTYLDGEG